MKKARSMRYRLFVTYAGIIIVMSIVYVLAFYMYEIREFTTRSLGAVEELSLGLSNKLDLEIQKMDQVTLNVVYSRLIKDTLMQISDHGSESESYTIEQISDIKTLGEFMVAAIGPTQSVRKLTIYDMNGNRISSGALFASSKYDPATLPWFNRVIEQEGSSLIGLPEKDQELADSFVFFKDKYFISLYRTYYGDFGELQGVIQAQQDADIIFSSLIELEEENDRDRRYFVFNSEGQQLYPYQGDHQTGKYYFDHILHTGKKSLYVDSPTGQGKVFCSQKNYEDNCPIAFCNSKDRY